MYLIFDSTGFDPRNLCLRTLWFTEAITPDEQIGLNNKTMQFDPGSDKWGPGRFYLEFGDGGKRVCIKQNSLCRKAPTRHEVRHLMELLTFSFSTESTTEMSPPIQHIAAQAAA